MYSGYVSGVSVMDDDGEHYEYPIILQHWTYLTNEETSPIEAFFAQFNGRGFRHNPRESSTSEFHRLQRRMGWRRGDIMGERAFSQFSAALTSQFNINFGTDAESLESWQRICETLNIEPIPDNLKDAKKVSLIQLDSTTAPDQNKTFVSQAVWNTHVNIVDLTDGFGGDDEIEKFDTEEALSAYTLAERKKFPLDLALAGGLLKLLLRRIDFPPDSNSKRNENGKVVVERKRGKHPGRGRGGARN